MHYKIPDSISFSAVPQPLIPGNKPIADDILLIKDANSGRQFFINQTTKIFIEKFNTPKTFDEVNKEIADEVDAPADKVKKIIQPFFRYIRHRHFIVPEDYLPCKKASPLFNLQAILGLYIIEKIIDATESIDIYKAIQIRSGKTVVIKLLKQPKKKTIEALKREFIFLRSLNSTGVVPKARSFIIEKGYSYFTQDFIDGLSLPQFIHRKKRVSLNEILITVSNILYAFKKIHENNIVHGDIHPSNILITGKNEIKVIDFGLALNSELDKDELVNFGGAYFFMPPERIQKTTRKKFICKPDLFSDVFQLGVVLYVFLYDEHPFNGITWEELATEIKEKQIQFPERSKYKFLVPAWMKNIIEKCVAKQPEDRFANAQQLYKTFSENLTNYASKIRPAVKV